MTGRATPFSSADSPAHGGSTAQEPRMRELKRRAQLLSPVVRIGVDGASDRVVHAIIEALERHELVKVKFVAQKEDKKQLVRQLEQQTGSRLVQQVGHTATYFRLRSAAPPDSSTD
jgi:RNA-binding protein